MTFSKKFCAKSPFKNAPAWYSGSLAQQQIRQNMREAGNKQMEEMERRQDEHAAYVRGKKAAKEESKDENGEEKVPWWKKLFKKSSFKNKAERERYAEQKRTGKLPRQYRGL